MLSLIASALLAVCVAVSASSVGGSHHQPIHLSGGSFDVWVSSEYSSTSVSYNVTVKPAGVWIGFGIGSEMTGADVVISDFFKTNLNRYVLTAKDSVSRMNIAPVLTGTSMTTNAGKTTITFTRPLAAGSGKAVEPTNDQHYVIAIGSNMAYGYHGDSKLIAKINLQSGTGQVVGEDEVISNNYLILLHGGIMVLSWGILFPAGALAIRYGKKFSLHKWLQAFTLLLALIAVAFAILSEGFTFEGYHPKFGLIIMVLALAQPISGWFVAEKSRSFHQVYGRILLFLAALTIFSGINQLFGTSRFFLPVIIAYSTILCTLTTIVIIKEVKLRKGYFELKTKQDSLGAELTQDSGVVTPPSV